MTKSLAWPALAGLIVLALLAGVLLIDPAQREKTPFASMGGDFTLESANGPVSLADYRGKYVIIYFGYTSCPDICPTSLGALSQAMKQLTPGELERIQGLFISVDPERDTLDKLQAYARYFHPSMIGITGSLETLNQVASQYGVYFHKVEIENSSMGYAVDHSSTIFLVDPEGKLKEMIQHSDSPGTILKQIRKVMQE